MAKSQQKTKLCNCCLKLLPVHHFYKNKRIRVVEKDGVRHVRVEWEPRPDCIKCHKTKRKLARIARQRQSAESMVARLSETEKSLYDSIYPHQDEVCISI